MDTVDPLRAVFAFLFVLGLIGMLALALKRYGHVLQSWGGFRSLATSADGSPMPQRLEIIEARYLDPRRKLVLVRRDDVEHLLLLAEEQVLVIESVRKNDEQ